MDFELEKVVRTRYSTRTFTGEDVDEATRQKIMDYANALSNPFGPKVKFALIDRKTSANGEKLGTYGVIKNAKLYIGATVPDAPGAQEGYGYEFEQLVLYITSLGLGSCWLGGTFNRGEFAKALDVKEDELFPCICPVGKAAAKKSLKERFMRSGIKADTRLPWNQIFFRDSFGTPLSEKEAGDFRYALEMVRLAPSAVNKQPWRVVKCGNVFHFYEAKTQPSEGKVDIQRVDLGIALNHFALAAEEKGVAGTFRTSDPGLTIPENTYYITSFIAE